MMGCNGRGHKWNCVCDFGGKRGALSNIEQFRSEELFVPKIPRRTKPNDRCSFCDAPVFFRVLQNAGRAYFDDPGAPWRKHPCLDQQSSSFLGSVSESELHWPQLQNSSARPAGRDDVVLRGTLRGKRWSAHLRVRQLQEVGVDTLCLERSFIQVRESVPGQFEIALFTEDLAKVLIRASSTERQPAIRHLPKPRKNAGESKSKLAPVYQAELPHLIGD